MRKPGEYVAAAMARLREGSLSEFSAVMRHGEQSATVTRVGSPYVGNDAINGDRLVDALRLLAPVADFPSLERGEAVMLDGAHHAVSSCRRDISGTEFSVGLSQELTPIIWTRGTSPLITDTVRGFIQEATPSLVAGHEYGRFSADACTGYVCPQLAHIDHILPGDQLKFEAGGTTYTVQQVREVENVGWILTLTARARGAQI